MSSLEPHVATLQPVRRWWLRFLIVAAIVSLASVNSRMSWPMKLFGAVLWTGLIGSYPQVRVRGDSFERAMVIMFEIGRAHV